jgi:hypothetical protein
MRNIKKKILVQEVECTMYDKKAKKEITEVFTVAEVAEMPPIPETCVLLEKKVLSEKEVVYTLTPAAFVANATIEEE